MLFRVIKNWFSIVSANKTYEVVAILLPLFMTIIKMVAQWLRYWTLWFSLYLKSLFKDIRLEIKSLSVWKWTVLHHQHDSTPNYYYSILEGWIN